MRNIAIRIRRLLAITCPGRPLSINSDVSDVREWLKYRNKPNAKSVAPSDPSTATLLRSAATTNEATETD